jgi:hypothetical protein
MEDVARGAEGVTRRGRPQDRAMARALHDHHMGQVRGALDLGIEGRGPVPFAQHDPMAHDIVYSATRPAFSPREISTVSWANRPRPAPSRARALRSTQRARITKAEAPSPPATSSATGSGAARWAAIRSASSIARAPITRSCPPTISLRRVDHGGPRRAAIAVLPFGEDGLGKRVLPAEVIPVIDMQRQGDHVLARGEVLHHRIGGRTGGAALAGEQLHHDGA